MRKGSFCFVILLLTVFFSGCAVIGPDSGGGSGGGGFGNNGDGTEAISQPTGNTPGTRWLAQVMDQYHSAYDVYSDADAAGNHFTVPAAIGAAPVLNTRYTNFAYSGLSCVRATGGSEWGGFYFLNGILPNGASVPQVNWGDTPNAGIDLTGATKLTFYARGENGGEQAEFFCGGVGLNGNAPTKPYHDSFMKTSTNVTLTTTWTKYTIDLAGKDLSYVLGGFGFSMTNANQTIYIDQIQYDRSRLNEPRLLLSYKTINSTNTFDNTMKNVAYTYDNAMAILAFLAAGEYDRARLVADALIYAQAHDRYYNDNRLRNAYRAGDISMPAGWTPNGKENTVPMSSYYDTASGSYLEDRSADSSDTGNQAWAMLAWLACYNLLNDSKYLTAAENLGNWIEGNLRDTRGTGGYMGQMLGYDASTLQTYKSTEHNLDLYAAFKRIYLITGDSTWNNRAIWASNFCISMWTNGTNVFLAGTRADGITPSFGNGDEPVPTDAQSWMLLSFKTLPVGYQKGISNAEARCRYPSTWGFDFNVFSVAADTSPHPDGIWYEGTAQMATAYLLTGQAGKYTNVMATIFAGRPSDGGMYACGPSGKDSISTGFWTSSGEWRYFRRQHVGATAWSVLAEKGLNAFWIGTSNAVIPPAMVNNCWFQLTGPDAFPGTIAYAGAAVSNANIFVFGGLVNGVITNGVWQYNTNVRVWTTRAVMPTKRRSAGTAVYNGKIYVFGGTGDGTTPTNVVEVYDPVRNTWTTKAAMPTKRYGLTAVTIGSYIYVTGGFGANGSATNVEERYDPSANTWLTRPVMPAPLGYSGASAYNNSKLYVFGGAAGTTSQAANNAYSYNGSWTSLGVMPFNAELFGQETVSNIIYMAGGIDGYSTRNVLSKTYAYNPANGSLTNYTDMLTPRYAMATCVLNGEIYTIGGIDATGSATGVVEKYRPYGVGGNSGDTNYSYSSSSSSSSTVSSTGNFNIYEDTTIMSVIWDVDTKADTWSDYGAGMTIEDDYFDYGEGNKSWRITGTGSWMGMGIRVNPLDSGSLKDMTAYRNGSLNFMYKGTGLFKVGIKSGINDTGHEQWISASSLFQYGLQTNNTWCAVSIPISDFPDYGSSGIDISKINSYFMLAADSSMGYTTGEVIRIDNIYWSASSGALPTAFYVSVNGNDNNDGSISAPFRSIQKGIDSAQASGVTHVNVTAGVFTPGNGLKAVNEDYYNYGFWYRGYYGHQNNPLKLYGGYSQDFTSRNGYTTLDGQGGLTHVVLLGDSGQYGAIANFTMDGFIVQGGYATGGFGGFNTRGAGIETLYLWNSLITNCIIRNNHADSYGGGIELNGGYNTICVTIVSNDSYYGGGLRIWGDNNVVSGYIGTNYCYSGAGVYVSGNNNTIGGEIVANYAANLSGNGGGGGVYIASGFSGNVLNGIIHYNVSQNNGGGVYCAGDNNTISGSITFNNATGASSQGGGVDVAGNYNLINALVTNNISVYNHDIRIGDGTAGNVISRP